MGRLKQQPVFGRLYYLGKGVTDDNNISLKWFLEAANKGYYISQFYFGLFYEKGRGVQMDKQYALE
ncbi:hypothetical protein K501DRAFT_202844 [Backusella circina FSU 941]|nr:hypothetical protein K501DRAFT_202844 [Backusella circina FSU 941]